MYRDIPQKKTTFARTNMTENDTAKIKQVVKSFAYNLRVTSKWQLQKHKIIVSQNKLQTNK